MKTTLAFGRLAAGVLALSLGLAACAAPVSTTRVDATVVGRDVGRSAITTGEPSWPTRNVLFATGLYDVYDERPEEALATLHKSMMAAGGDPDLLFALAELSFLHGKATGKKAYTLAATVYAWAFLFPDGAGEASGRFDPRTRIAADLYNWSLTGALASQDSSEVSPRGGTFELPFGPITVAFDPASLRTGTRELVQLVPAAELEVHGLAMRYRWPGLGAPLAAATRPVAGAGPERDFVAPRIRVPLTALLRIPDARRSLVEGRPLTSTLDLHLLWGDESVTIAGETVPLESEPTAALAHGFTGIPVLELEMLGLLGRIGAEFRDRPPLISATPYTPGLIPVVFVHGTGSSIVRWAEMYNRLLSDVELRRRYQFWFFQYDSGNPILLSSLRLRETLAAAVKRVDPEGKDPALSRMVLVGHSQGGLLVKMQVISSGTRLWDAAATQPLESLTLEDETRDLLKRALFVEPSPLVSRVIFIATPHRGSFVAGRRFIANIVRYLLSLPLSLTGLAADVNRNPGALRPGVTVPSAVDNMSPRHHFIQASQTIPVAPSVKAHSIVAVTGEGPFENGDDGVVEYSSAHIDGVESELVVRSTHSTQGRPETIEEIRRILRLHADVK